MIHIFQRKCGMEDDYGFVVKEQEEIIELMFSLQKGNKKKIQTEQ